MNNTGEAKIKTKKGLKKVIEELKQRGEKVVSVNGTFDIIHVGHLKFLQKAKSQGDFLVVLVNSDASVERLKGEKRPIFNQKERVFHLANLSSVDFVTVFSEDTPLALLKYLKPDIHAKGGSFVPERVEEERELVESWGGSFKIFKLTKGYSTTKIIQRILEKCKDK